MSERKHISKKIRFEIFKRDSFACQYCGKKSPDVVLNVDHIEPISRGGSNEIFNLVTACAECNSGKSDRKLSDDTVIERQRTTLEQLQIRREQLEMMFKWQESLMGIEQDSIGRLASYWERLAYGWTITENGLKTLGKLLNKFDVDVIIPSMRIAADSYLIWENDVVTQESWGLAYSKIHGICYSKTLDDEFPGFGRIPYIKAILRNRVRWVDEIESTELLRNAIRLNLDIDDFTQKTKSVRRYNDWANMLNDFILDQEDNDDV